MGKSSSDFSEVKTTFILFKYYFLLINIMGLLVHDEIMTPFGIAVRDTYHSFRGKCRIEKDPNTGKRVLHGFCEMRTVNDLSKPPFNCENVSVDLADVQVVGDPVALLYSEYKRRFVSVVDC